MRVRLALRGRDGLLRSCMTAAPALAQKQGGTLRISHRDNPPSASIHEESTISVNQPFMAVFNNLVLFDPNEKVNSPDKIVPDLAESWAWNDDKTKLTFKLRQGVKWHDGKPFTSADVKCTWDALMGKGDEKLDIIRKNPRKIWYINLKDVTTNGDNEVTFNLGRPQPSFLSMLAAGYSPVYSCHVPGRDMRSKPIGTGPFKVVGVQAQRIDQAGAQSRLLEEGPALSRRHRLEDRAQPQHAHAGLRRRRIRHDVRFRRHLPAAQGRQGAEARRRVRGAADQRQLQHPGQPRQAAVRQSADPQGDGAGARQQGVRRHPEPGQRSRRRGHAAAAGRLLGHAQGDAADPARPLARHREEPRRGAQDHGGPGLRSRTSRSRSRSRRATSRSTATRR